MKPLIEIIENFYYIRTKEKELKLLVFNESQKEFYNIIKPHLNENKPVIVIVLKARQLGISTASCAIIFGRTSLQKNVKSLIVAHQKGSTDSIYAMTKLIFDKLPLALKPMLKNSNSKMLNFENPTNDQEEKQRNPGLRSQIRVETAGTKGLGRGETYNNIHISEFAFWGNNKEEQLLGLLQAVPPVGSSLVVIESTANGYESFKRLWDDAVKGKSNMIPIFLPWKNFKEYSMKYTEFELTDEEKEVMKEHGLTYDQITWRRWCINNKCGGDIDRFKQEYPLTPEEAFMLSGNPVFNQQSIISRIKYLEDKPMNVLQGGFGPNGEFIEDSTGEIKLYSKPIKNVPYVIGGDTAGDGSDYFEAYVIDNTTGRQVAKYTCQSDEDLFARQMNYLGRYYNNALLGIESNFSSYPIKELEKLDYPNQYVREVMDTYTNTYQKRFGFNTNSSTRPMIIAKLVEIARDNIDLIVDVDLLRQMLSFVKNEQGRPEAAAGEHDDKVMACAICYGIREQQSMVVKKDMNEEEFNEYDSFLKYGG